MFIYSFIYLSICLFIYLFIYLFVYLLLGSQSVKSKDKDDVQISEKSKLETKENLRKKKLKEIVDQIPTKK